MKTLPAETKCKPAIEMVESRFRNIAEMFRAAAASGYSAQIAHAAELIGNTFAEGHKALVFGNGGSASDAQHFCGELVVRFQAERRSLPAIALCADVAVLTACANDYAFRDIFARQIEALGNPGDVAIGFSTSGGSSNVVRAFQIAKSRGLVTILFTGPTRGEACHYSDLVLDAPGIGTAHVQEIHLASYHAICELIDVRFG